MSGCLCNRDSLGDVHYLSINGRQTGVIGLPDIFETWISEGKRPEDLSPADILKALRRNNYVSGPVENHYVQAVRSEYKKFYKEFYKENTSDG